MILSVTSSTINFIPQCPQSKCFTLWWQINSVETITRFVSQSSKANISEASLSDWSWFNEPVGISSDNAFTVSRLLEQINTTADKSDYLWYSLRYQFGSQRHHIYICYGAFVFWMVTGYILQYWHQWWWAFLARWISSSSSCAITWPCTSCIY